MASAGIDSCPPVEPIAAAAAPVEHHGVFCPHTGDQMPGERRGERITRTHQHRASPHRLHAGLARERLS